VVNSELHVNRFVGTKISADITKEGKFLFLFIVTSKQVSGIKMVEVEKQMRKYLLIPVTATPLLLLYDYANFYEDDIFPFFLRSPCMFFGYNAHLLPFMCVSYQLLAILD
jgi:hypothetical protein